MNKTIRIFSVLLLVLSATVYAQDAKPKEEKAESANHFDAWRNNAAAVPKLVPKVVKDFAGKDDAGRKEIFNTLCKLTEDESLLPAVRYNAVLAVGQLEEKEKTPHTGAITYLADLYNKTSTPAFLKFGALLGIVRSADASIENQSVKEKMLSVLLNALKEKQSQREDVQDWFRETALDGLAALKTANDNVADALIAVIKDDNNSLELRSRAVKVFGDLDYTNSSTDVKKISSTVLGFQQDVRKAGLKKIQEQFEKDEKTNSQRRTDPIAKKKEKKAAEEAAFLRLPAPQKKLITEIIKDTKTALECVQYAIGNKSGLRKAFKDGDKEISNFDECIKDIKGLFKVFDEGPESPKDGKKKPAAKTAARPPANLQPNQAGKEVVRFNVNLYQLQKALDSEDAVADNEPETEN